MRKERADYRQPEFVSRLSDNLTIAIQKLRDTGGHDIDEVENFWSALYSQWRDAGDLSNKITNARLQVYPVNRQRLKEADYRPETGEILAYMPKVIAVQNRLTHGRFILEDVINEMKYVSSDRGRGLEDESKFEAGYWYITSTEIEAPNIGLHYGVLYKSRANYAQDKDAKNASQFRGEEPMTLSEYIVTSMAVYNIWGVPFDIHEYYEKENLRPHRETSSLLLGTTDKSGNYVRAYFDLNKINKHKNYLRLVTAYHSSTIKDSEISSLGCRYVRRIPNN